MTPHDEPTETPFDPIDAAVDQHLTAATRQARAATHALDRHAFLAAARTRRDRLRRRRRAWTVATPIVAAALVVVAVGVIASGGDNSSTHLASSSQAQASASTASGALTCPTTPGSPNTESGKPLFDFTPTALELCTYGSDGRLVATNAVPGPGQASVGETLDYLQRAYVDRPAGSGETNCAPDEIAVNRIGVVTGDEDHTEIAWIASAGCTTPGDPADERGSAIGTTEGSPADGRGNPTPIEPSGPTSP